jgi:hypothetical protein
MHGGALGLVMLLVVIALAGGFVYVVVGRRRAERDAVSDRDPETTDRRPER